MPTKNILVVGGAGYIGSHMVEYLHQAGHTPIVLDDLSTGHRDAVFNAKLIEGSLADLKLLDEVFSTHAIDAVMHFASFIQVGESVQIPGKYYQNNVSNTLNLLMTMLKHGVNKFIFSSTAAVYGEPHYTPIDEKHPIKPINPYGHSKSMVEQMLADFSTAHGLQYAVLRYFNAAGADPSGKLHERHDPETHLIPLLLQVARGERKNITVYGQHYATPDGTCIRDYVHVTDLCDAHFKALNFLNENQKYIVCNLGTGKGHSVKQVIAAVEEVTGCEIPIIYGAERAGDPATLVANPQYAMKMLQWVPQYSDLKTIILHASCHPRESVIPAKAGTYSANVEKN